MTHQAGLRGDFLPTLSRCATQQQILGRANADLVELLRIRLADGGNVDHGQTHLGGFPLALGGSLLLYGFHRRQLGGDAGRVLRTGQAHLRGGFGRRLIHQSAPTLSAATDASSSVIVVSFPLFASAAIAATVATAAAFFAVLFLAFFLAGAGATASTGGSSSAIST